MHLVLELSSRVLLGIILDPEKPAASYFMRLNLFSLVGGKYYRNVRCPKYDAKVQ